MPLKSLSCSGAFLVDKLDEVRHALLAVIKEGVSVIWISVILQTPRNLCPTCILDTYKGQIDHFGNAGVSVVRTGARCELCSLGN